MALARISAGVRGFEVRTFECSTCERTEQLSMAVDPMKTDAVGWLASELRPPQWRRPSLVAEAFGGIRPVVDNQLAEARNRCLVPANTFRNTRRIWTADNKNDVVWFAPNDGHLTEFKGDRDTKSKPAGPHAV
jgi:hypothetical protein